MSAIQKTIAATGGTQFGTTAMATYIIGSGGDYATFAAAEAAISLPEAGGTRYEVTGELIENETFSAANYVNGLIIAAVAGEEADGAKGGAFVRGKLTLDSVDPIIDCLNVTEIDMSGATDPAITNCDVGRLNTGNRVIDTPAGGYTITNTHLREGSNDQLYQAMAGGVSNGAVTNVTAVDASRFGIMRSASTNCLVIGAGNEDFQDEYVAGSNYNASSDSSAPGANSFTTATTADLVDYAGGNFNLAADSPFRGAGLNGANIGADLDPVAGGLALTGPLTFDLTFDLTNDLTG